jgi:RNAse (barnase) inhibitor barstar
MAKFKAAPKNYIYNALKYNKLKTLLKTHSYTFLNTDKLWDSFTKKSKKPAIRLPAAMGAARRVSYQKKRTSNIEHRTSNIE